MSPGKHWQKFPSCLPTACHPESRTSHGLPFQGKRQEQLWKPPEAGRWRGHQKNLQWLWREKEAEREILPATEGSEQAQVRVSIGLYSHVPALCSENGNFDIFSNLGLNPKSHQEPCLPSPQPTIHSSSHQINQPKPHVSHIGWPFSSSSSSISFPFWMVSNLGCTLELSGGYLKILMLDFHSRISDLNGLKYGLGIMIFKSS